MKTIKNNSDEIFNKKINAEKAIYKILRSGEYGGLITEEEWHDTNKAKFSFCNVSNKILIIPYINQRTAIAFHTIMFSPFLLSAIYLFDNIFVT